MKNLTKDDLGHNNEHLQVKPCIVVTIGMRTVLIERVFVMKIILLIQNSFWWACYVAVRLKMSGKFFAGDTEQQETNCFSEIDTPRQF